MDMPTDPFMLMSFLNMKLRDEYASLDELCSSLGIDKDETLQAMAAAGFEYSSENNKFW